MSTARDEILARIRSANQARRPGDLPARLGRVEPHILPMRAQGSHAELVDRFVSMAEQAAASIDRVSGAAGESGVPGAIAAYLERQGLAGEIVIAPHQRLTGMNWRGAPSLSVRHGAAVGADRVGVTPALAGIAETGTLLVHSGATLPNTLHFLPETHIAVLWTGDVVGSYERAWERLHASLPDGEWPPRTATLITGPSRTSDIEKTLQIGVHGPRRLHIVLVDGEET